MGRNQTKTCDVCFKSMRGDILKRHMKKHDGKTEGQMSAKMSKSMIETNQQFGAGRGEPEKEKNTWRENEELYEQRHENDSHQVEPAKEKNPQQENVGEEVEE